MKKTFKITVVNMQSMKLRFFQTLQNNNEYEHCI